MMACAAGFLSSPRLATAWAAEATPPSGPHRFLGSERTAEVVGSQLAAGGATEACSKLVGAATAAWQQRAGDYCDDITAIVARLDHTV